VPEHVRWRKITFSGFDSPLLRVLNLKYVFAADDRTPVAADRVARVYPAARGRLWELRDPQPRSFLVHEAVAARSDSEAAELLRDQPAAVFSRVVLAADGGMVEPLEGTEEPAASSVSVVEYAPRRSVWRVRTNRAGYLFTGDAYYPGWNAELDGRPVPLQRANLAFRAVYVPAGEHLIVHRYEPLSIRIGLGLSAASLIGLGLILLRARRHGESGRA
jgi:hypothetical protein